MYQQKQYIKFLLKSTNQHGVHSPFVYDLVTKCFYDSKHYPEYKKLKDYRHQLLANKQELEITDLGAGSKVHSTNKRSIKSIASNSGSTYKRSKLLFRLSRYFQYNKILELGTSLGIATRAIQVAQPEAHIISIEGCPNISNTAKAYLDTSKNLELLIGDFDMHIDQLKQETFDLVFFDGNHSQEATLRYFEKLLPHAHNDTMFIFDDIYWSKDMTAAWETIKKHPEVRVTVDTFFWGLVFFRKEQVEEHFRIRL
ncbi:class I SAM-dependent methyltransferase [Xanthomarina sp. F1114]|uniref:O-methyltransferase n=1 Tax=Xanthomarina sp. F1114 TaxID=2996019 RepID=UPI00225E0DE0|nr:class I SAM-dependent methyltransferase [Xanthomarina sp. F1114]MCX7549145.1 class I SAM-dependent methyltransferase [Xanthomarina sp. F1114]